MLTIPPRIESSVIWHNSKRLPSIAEPTHRYVEVEGLKLHYLDWGGDPDKRTFVLLHGGAAHVHWWDGVAPLLTPYGRVLALDFRGHGRSQWAKDGMYGPPSYLKDVRGLIESLGTRVILVGHSMGGAVAQWVAVTHPELLEALIIGRCAARAAAAVSPADVAMAAAIARRRSSRAAIGRRHHKEIPTAAAADLPDATGGRAACAARRGAATQWHVGVSLRSGDAGMAQARREDDAAEDQADQAADAAAARRSKRAGQRVARQARCIGRFADRC